MKMNRKGESGIIIIFFIFMFLIFVMPIYEHIETKNNFKIMEITTQSYLTKIEENGYLREIDKVSLEQEVSKEFNHYKVEGTKEKVKPGEEVFIKVSIQTKNSYGGVIDSKDIILKGRAR